MDGSVLKPKNMDFSQVLAHTFSNKLKQYGTEEM